MITVERLERALEIAELRDYSQKRTSNIVVSINGFAGTFPRLRKKYLHELEISKMATARINKYLVNYLKKIL